MQENGQKETDKIKIELKNLGTVNKNKVIITRGNKQVDLYFSYETLIAVNDFVSVNDWSMTTGKFLNELELDKNKRIPHAEILKIAQEIIKEVLYD